MKKKPLILLLLSLCAAPVFAQSDTVESRSVTSKIGDSASIRYHLGALCLEQSGVKQFLHFKNTRPSSELPLNYQTRDFTITTGTPTLSMFRFARFDGSSSLLNATTTILYIVEICNSTTGAVLARVDTLACYVDDKGALGYTTYPPSNQYPHCNLSTIATGTRVYARLERIASLPPGVTIHDEPDAEIIFGYPPLDNIISYPVSETEFYSEVPNTTSDTFTRAIAPPPVKAYFMDSIGGRFISYPGDRITSKPLQAIHFSTPRSGVVSVTATYIKDFMKEDAIHTITIVQAGKRIPFFVEDSILKDKRKFAKFVIASKEVDTLQNFTFEQTMPTPDNWMSINANNDTTYHKRITAVVGQQLVETRQQINKGNNFLLLATKRLPRGVYEITVKMDNEIIHQSKRTIY